MTPDEFIDGIRNDVLDASVSDTISVVRSPPGRRPSAELVELSEWYKQLGESDRAMIRRILELEARQAVFGMLAVIDGARRMPAQGNQVGHFELRYVNGEKVEILGGPAGAALHELL
jgi:hypothetical protein